MGKWGVHISMVLCFFLLFTFSGCKVSDIRSGSSGEYTAVSPTCPAADVPIVTPVCLPTNITTVTPMCLPTDIPVTAPTNIPTNIPTCLPTDMPTASPSLILPAVTGDAKEETLDDLSAFFRLKDCFLDYTFQVEEIGTEDYRTSYMVNGNYDLDSDGKEDYITILQKGRNSNLSYIEINQTKLSFNVDSPYDGEVHIVDLDKNDPYLEVASFDAGPSGDPEYLFFRYDGSSIYEIGRIDAYACIDGNGRLVSYFDRNNYFEPRFCSAWYEIINNALVRKNNNIDQYMGQMYDFAGGDAYFIPYEEQPDNPNFLWDEEKHFDACRVKIIDICGGMNSYYIELPTGEKGLMYFWIGD